MLLQRREHVSAGPYSPSRRAQVAQIEHRIAREGDGPGHKPAHTVFNLQGGKAFGRQWTLVASTLNVADNRFLLDESNTVGGTHYNMPRQVSVGLRQSAGSSRTAAVTVPVSSGLVPRRGERRRPV